MKSKVGHARVIPAEFKCLSFNVLESCMDDNLTINYKQWMVMQLLCQSLAVEDNQ